MKRLIKRYVLKAQVDKENDEVNEGTWLPFNTHEKKKSRLRSASFHLCNRSTFFPRWVERNQAGYFQSSLWAPGGEVPGDWGALPTDTKAKRQAQCQCQTVWVTATSTSTQTSPIRTRSNTSHFFHCPSTNDVDILVKVDITVTYHSFKKIRLNITSFLYCYGCTSYFAVFKHF